MYSARCGTDLDHGVLVTGYSLDADTPYFLVKNSWGSSWGEDGFFRLALNRNQDDGQCGITKAPSYPVIKEDDKKHHGGHHHKHHHHHHKKSPSPSPAPKPAPGPPPSGNVCDESTTCAEDQTCCCASSSHHKCLEYGCCPYPNATCCKDHAVSRVSTKPQLSDST